MPIDSMKKAGLVAAFAMAGLAAQAAAASATGSEVEAQLRSMEQRLTEMEDRLEATSAALEAAKTKVDEQQERLSDAGLVEEHEAGTRSGLGRFVERVEVSGVFASSFSYRFLDPDDDDGDVFGSFRHPNANTFQIDQAWITLDKTPTEESRGGFHADLVWGETAESQGGDRDSGLIYTAYASWLAPVGHGVQLDAGRLPKVLGAESMQTSQNFNISQGLLFQLQPNATTGVQASTAVLDGLVLTAGIVNDVFVASNVDTSRDKVYYGEVALVRDRFGIEVGGFWGKDDRITGASLPPSTPGTNRCDSGDDCFTSVLDAVVRVFPTDDLALWLDYTWVRTHGDDTADGDVHGVAGAGRWALTEATGLATRVEYLRADRSFVRGRQRSTTTTTLSPGGSATRIEPISEPLGPAGVVAGGDEPFSILLGDGVVGQSEIVSWTTTLDHRLAEGLMLRGEVRWDRNLSNSELFANGSRSDSRSDRDDQLTGLAELFYEF